MRNNFMEAFFYLGGMQEFVERRMSREELSREDSEEHSTLAHSFQDLLVAEEEARSIFLIASTQHNTHDHLHMRHECIPNQKMC